jgi:hypothetical protein
MDLVDAYTHPRAHRVLYDLLHERKPHEVISHKKMPSWEEHCRFVDSRPYQFWYLIRGEMRFLGAIYLTQRLSEIGCWIFDVNDGADLRARVIKMLMDRHPRPRYVSNVSPKNSDLTAVFSELGFKHIQNTYEMIP